MQIFKRGIFSLIKSLGLAVLGPIVLAIIIYFFTENMMIIIIPPAIVGLWLLKLAIFSENIRFEIEKTGQFRYIQRNEIKLNINLSEYYCGYRAKTSDGSADNLTLSLLKVDGKSEEERIDCTALGLSKFYKMYDLIESYTKKENIKMQAVKKKEK